MAKRSELKIQIQTGVFGIRSSPPSMATKPFNSNKNQAEKQGLVFVT